MIEAVLGYKGNQAAAKAARQTAEFNAQVAENEAVVLQRRKVDEEANMRKQSDRLIASQRVATAASGIQMSGSALDALADSYFNTEMDALRIQYAADIEQTAKASEAALSRAEGRARSTALKTASYQSLLAGAEKAATYMA
tara:strand:- start:759 stop:1181 length:423 start_codon:yes stop_codon:yes gene_type:complete